MAKYFITTAIDYPNGEPHCGHAYEKLITDIYARWHRQLNDDVFFLTGTDENSQKIVEAAEKESISTEEFLEKNVDVFKKLCKQLDITNNYFVRTTDASHKKLAQDVFAKVLKKGEIYLGKYRGKYCKFEETFLTEKDLKDGNCPSCGRPAVNFEEDAYFFKLSKYQNAIIRLIEKDEYKIIPEYRKNEILSRLKNEPLHDLCVSRSTQKWGIKVPGDEKHVIYVWFDALLNYCSGVNYPENKKWWPADCHVIGKDIIFFHAVYWPAILLAADFPLPKKLYVHGFINAATGEKMSKSKGNVIDPLYLINNYGEETLRYYLARTIPSGQDGNFSEEEMLVYHNNELANDFGNLVRRLTTLIDKNFNGKLSNQAFSRELSFSQFLEAEKLMLEYKHDKALAEIWSVVKIINKYFTEKEPWKITDKNSLALVLYNTAESIRFVTTYLYSFLPKACENIASQLSFNISKFNELKWGEGSFTVNNPAVLFPKLEKKKEEEFPLLLRVAEIEKVEIHPEAEKLYVLQINLGDEKRQLVAGIRHHYSPQELRGKKIIVVTNLKRAKLRGVESQGMLLAVEENNVVGLLTTQAPVGAEVKVEGMKNRASIIRIEEFTEAGLEAKDGKIYAKDRQLFASGKAVFVEKVKNGKVR
ncbi:MAG: methionine--tRNA ligase [Candidatus Woesearchaeota archaeon]